MLENVYISLLALACVLIIGFAVLAVAKLYQGQR